MTVSSQGLTVQQKAELEGVKSKFRTADKEAALNGIFAAIVQTHVAAGGDDVKERIAQDVVAIVLRGKGGKPIDPGDY
jgi:hypothetical protein